MEVWVWDTNDIKEQARLDMSSDKQEQQKQRIEQRKLFNYYEHHVSGVQLVEVDRALDPKRWRVFYGIYRVRQSLDLWDMEKKTYQGQALAEARRKEIKKWLADLDLAIKDIPADDKMLTFTVPGDRLERMQQTHQLKPLLASLLREVGGVEADLQELGAIVRRDRVTWDDGD